MSKLPVVIVVLFALVLGGVAFVVLRKPSASDTTQPVAWLVNLDAAQLRSLKIEWEGGAGAKAGAPATLQKEPTTGEWMLSREGSVRWPIGVERLRPFLRLMNETARLPGENGARPPTDATTITFTLGDGSARVLRVGGSPLGGKVVALIEDGATLRVVLVEDGLRKLVQADSLLSWREARAIPRSGVEPSRIRLETTGGRVHLSRVQGRWAITMPVACPASEDAMKSLVRQIASMRADRLLDEVDPTSAIVGAENPSTFIRFESDLRLSRGDTIERATLIEEVRVGKPSDMGGSSFYATISAKLLNPATNAETALWGPATVTFAKDKLDALKADVASYASKRASSIPGADVSGVSVAPDSRPFVDLKDGADAPHASLAEARKFRRSIKGWEVLDSVGAPRTLEGADVAGIAGLVRALTDVDAAALGTNAASDVASLATCTIDGAGSAGSEVVRLGVGRDNGKAILVIRSGKVYRVYNDEWVAGLLEWIRTQLKPEG